ncbi:MAG: protein kinase [Bryobacteraceae bacterium]
MPSERWKQVEALFEAAQQQPVDQRAEFLRQACPDHPEVCAEVESLLKAADSRDPLLDGSPLSSIAERAPALKPGDTLGNFEIVAMIGRGGMGEVYRARDLRLKREVAIKTLPSGFASDRDRIARFEREARAASALNHPNIVSVYDIGTEGGVSFIVSELVDGETLAQAIQRGPLSLRKLIETSTQICDGLAAAHSAGVVHRDLKPGNIMLTRDGRAKILDFGLARQDHAHGVDSTTVEASHPGMIMGTPGYMSPEQVRCEPTDARSDIFSLGVILYEMASGKPAFRGGSSVEVMNSILNDDPPELPQASPPSLDRIVRRCIEKRPSRRFQSAADLGFALTSLTPSPKLEERPKRRAWMKWAVTAALALAVTAGAVYLSVVSLPKAPAQPELTLRRLTNDPIFTRSVAISPDGKLVAYDKDGDIWVEQADGGGGIRLTDDKADDKDPAFSSDGTQIAFRSERDGGGVYVVPVLGGQARELVHEGKRPSFSPDGRWLMYWIGPGIGQSGKLFVRPLSGGPPVQVGAKTPVLCGAVWSPDGSRILFEADCVADLATVWVYKIEGNDLKPNHDVRPGEDVIDQWLASPPRLLTWKRVADAYVVTTVPISPDGTRVTGPPQNLTSVTDQLLRVSAAMDGRVALAVSTAKQHIWGLPIDTKGHATGEAKQLTNGSEDEMSPSLSRDGRKLVFFSQRANSLRLFYKDLATGKGKELSTDAGSGGGVVFGPDGAGVLCGAGSASGSLLYIPLSGGLPKKISDKAAIPWDWSPDGKTLLFFHAGDLSKPRWGVVRQLDLGSLSQTTFLDDPEFETWQAHFSHDGRWVTFNATPNDRTSSRVYVVPFRKALAPRNEWIPITQGGWQDKPRFSSDDKLIFMQTALQAQVASEAVPHQLSVQNLTADMRPEGNPVRLYSPPDNRRIITGEISAGPRLIVFTQADLAGNIWLLEPAKGTK